MTFTLVLMQELNIDALFLELLIRFPTENCVTNLLLHYGVTGKLLHWIKDYLSD